jgi:hypothetical protein
MFVPWQAALIQRLSFNLQQSALEQGALRNCLRDWYPEERHSGAYIEPRYLSVRNRSHDWMHFYEPFPFDTLPASIIEEKKNRDG